MAFYSLQFQSWRSFNCVLSLCFVKHSLFFSTAQSLLLAVLLFREVLSRADKIVAHLSPLFANYSSMVTSQVPRRPWYNKKRKCAHIHLQSTCAPKYMRLWRHAFQDSVSCLIETFNWALVFLFWMTGIPLSRRLQWRPHSVLGLTTDPSYITCPVTSFSDVYKSQTGQAFNISVCRNGLLLL